jgi:hypothetical protein
MSTAAEFLEKLRPGGPWVLTAIVPDGPTETITARTAAEVDAFVCKHDGKQNLYYHVNPTRTAMSKKAAKADIAAVEYLLADLDPNADEDSAAAKARYLEQLDAFEPKPTVVVDSGNGIQCLWRLTKPIELSAEQVNIVADVEARTAAVMVRLGAKAGTQNVDRILRLPGTTNLPNKKKRDAGRMPCPTKLIAFNGASYSLDAFPPPTDPNKSGTPEDHAQQDGEQEDKLDLDKIIRQGENGRFGGDRSRAVWWVTCEMLRRGYLPSTIMSTLRDPRNKISQHVLEQNNPHGYAAKQVAKATKEIASATNAQVGEVVLVCAADVVPRGKDWLWEGHLLRGAQELMTGIPGLAKSQVQCSYTAHVTTGKAWPNGWPGLVVPMSVIMVTAEDVLDQEVVPRLIAAGANLAKVHILKCIKTDNKQRQFLISEDLEKLAKEVARLGDVALITLDPITAYMGGKINSHKTTEVRSQLGPLKDFAEHVNVALSTVTHPPKNAGPRAIDHFIGSQAFIAHGRIGHACIEEIKPEDGTDEGGKPTGRILFTHVKYNPSAKMATLAYRVEVLTVGQDPANGKSITAPYVVWDKGIVDISADAAIAAVSDHAKGRKRRSATEFLRQLLANGPVDANTIMARARALGISDRQLRNASEELRVVKEKPDFASGWVWRLPTTPAADAEIPF